MRNFFAAGIAPRCPEIEENDFASIGGQLKVFAVWRTQSEVWRELMVGCAGAGRTGRLRMPHEIHRHDCTKHQRNRAKS
jgi:hypothetical protein